MDRLMIKALVGLSLAAGGHTAFGFVLLSGPEEARLNVIPEAPEVSFIYQNKAPTIKDKADFEDGRYKDMTDDQLFPVNLQMGTIAFSVSSLGSPISVLRLWPTRLLKIARSLIAIFK